MSIGLQKANAKRLKEKEPRKKAKEETHCVTPGWKIKVNRYPPRSCYSIPGKKKNNSSSQRACF